MKLIVRLEEQIECRRQQLWRLNYARAEQALLVLNHLETVHEHNEELFHALDKLEQVVVVAWIELFVEHLVATIFREKKP